MSDSSAKVAADYCLQVREPVCEAPLPYLLGRVGTEASVAAIIRQGFKTYELREPNSDVQATLLRKVTLPAEVFGSGCAQPALPPGLRVKNTFIDIDEDPPAPPARSKSEPTFDLIGEDASDSEMEERSNSSNSVLRETWAGEKPQSNESGSLPDEHTPRLEECTPHLSRVSSYQSVSSKWTNSTEDPNEEHLSPKIPILNIERRPNGSLKVTAHVCDPFMHKQGMESEEFDLALSNGASTYKFVVLPADTGKTFKQCQGKGRVLLTCQVAPEQSSMMNVSFSVGEGKKGKQKPLGPVPFVPRENASCCLPEGQCDWDLRASQKSTEANNATGNRRETKKSLVISLLITPVQIGKQ